MNYSVSVIIPTLNEAANIGGLLRSLLNQSNPPREIIVVDGRSEDETVEIVRSFPAVTLVESERGLAHQRNQGGYKANGELLFFIDADTRLRPDFIERCSAEMDRRRLSMACPSYQPYETTALIRLIHHGYNLMFWLLQKLVPSGGGSCIIVRRELFTKTPGFREDILFDDMKFLRDARTRGGCFGFLTPSIGVSDRRFRNDGVIKTAGLYLLLTPIFLFNLYSLTKLLGYRYGHYDKR